MKDSGRPARCLICWHLNGRAAHRQGKLGPIDIDTFKVGTAHALPVEGDLLVIRLEGNGEPSQLRVNRRRFDFSSAEPELHIDLALIDN